MLKAKQYIEKEFPCAQVCVNGCTTVQQRGNNVPVRINLEVVITSKQGRARQFAQPYILVCAWDRLVTVSYCFPRSRTRKSEFALVERYPSKLFRSPLGYAKHVCSVLLRYDSTAASAEELRAELLHCALPAV